jgi:hypothetical protein
MNHPKKPEENVDSTDCNVFATTKRKKIVRIEQHSMQLTSQASKLKTKLCFFG